MKEGFQALVPFNSTFCQISLLVQMCLFQEYFGGKSEAQVEDAVLLRNVSVYLHAYMAGLSRTRDNSEAELCGILHQYLS